MDLVLASASPRRRELLGFLGVPFDCIAPHADESPEPGESAPALVVRLSRLKAAAARRECPHALVIACDTDGELDSTILGKPRDAEHALAMLAALRGRAHSVYTAFTVSGEDIIETEVVRSLVWMRDYSDAEIDAYVESGDPLDKAASYGVQHPGFRPVARVEGCFANVMGLPLCRLYHALARHIDLPPPQLECIHHPETNCSVEKLVVARPT
jgi:MAF protein